MKSVSESFSVRPRKKNDYLEWSLEEWKHRIDSLLEARKQELIEKLGRFILEHGAIEAEDRIVSLVTGNLWDTIPTPARRYLLGKANEIVTNALVPDGRNPQRRHARKSRKHLTSNHKLSYLRII